MSKISKKKRLTRPAAMIEAGTKFTPDSISNQIEIEWKKLLWGGLDRSEFERKLFEFEDLTSLPLWHLHDHCVRMPLDQAEALLTQCEHAITEHFWNMLCSTHRQGAELVAEALGLTADKGRAPNQIARRLLRVFDHHPEFATNCLRGSHGYAMEGLVDAPREDVAELKELVITTAIYFAALELQLIAARLRAIEKFRFAVELDSDDPRDENKNTVGSLINEMRALVSEIKNLNKTVMTGKSRGGDQTDLHKLAKERAQMFAALTFGSRRNLKISELQAELQHAYANYIMPMVTNLEPILDGFKVSKDDDKETQSVQRGVIRQRIATRWGKGVTGGEQLAFASYRLHAYARKLPTIVNKWQNARPPRGDHWFAKLAGEANRDVAKLLLVSRAAVWRSRDGNPAAFKTDQSPDDLRSGLDNFVEDKNSRVPGSELLITIKTKIRDWAKDQATDQSPASPAPGYKAHLLYDIQPAFRFALADGPAPKARKDRSHIPVRRFRPARRIS